LENKLKTITANLQTISSVHSVQAGSELMAKSILDAVQMSTASIRVKTKQNKAKQNKTKQNKTKQNKTKQNKTKQNKKSHRRDARDAMS
jgi:hypothetical protein